VEADYVIRGETLGELEANIAQRLADISEDVDGFTLNEGFATGLRAAMGRYSEQAARGVDEDFGRGNLSNQHYDPPPREGLSNGSLAPIREEGPYYAMIMGAATLDTKCGPKIDAKGRVLKAGGRPIPGLYGAGNCIASPAGAAYWGGGSTLGPALVYGTLAGTAVAQEPVREVAGEAVA
jgi:3-oxosteroid 1-dehydrogenase